MINGKTVHCGLEFKMLKNIIGIKDAEIAKINAINLEDKTWDEVKRNF